MRYHLILLALLIIFSVVISTNCICVDYFNPPMQWYNYSYEPAENVTIGMIIYTLEPQPVTILGSGSGMINFSVYSSGQPRAYHDLKNEQLNLSLWLSGSSEVHPGVGSDIYVYLPPGPNYTLLVFNGGDGNRLCPVTSEYTGGNLTMWVNDPDHSPYDFYEQNRNSTGYQMLIKMNGK